MLSKAENLFNDLLPPHCNQVGKKLADDIETARHWQLQRSPSTRYCRTSHFSRMVVFVWEVTLAGTIVPTTMLNLVSDLSFVYLANLAKLNYHRICYLSLLYTLHRYLFEHFFSGHMMLVAEDSNKVVAFKSYSRMCSLCARSGLKQHKGECNNSFSGTS